MDVKRETHIGGAHRRFPSTAWTVLRNVRSPVSVERRAALHRLLGLYWKPVYCLIRRSWGKSNEDAKDLTQQFFLSVFLEGAFLEKFAPNRGSFRAFLKAAVTNFMRDAAKSAGRKKRGGDADLLSLSIDGFDVSEMVPEADTLTPEEVFDKAWKNEVLAQAIGLLEKTLRAGGKGSYFEVFKRYDLCPDAESTSYVEIGERLGLSADTVKNYLTRTRLKFKEIVTDVVRDYVDDEGEALREVRELFGI